MPSNGCRHRYYASPRGVNLGVFMKRSLVAAVALCAALYAVPSNASVVVTAIPSTLAPVAPTPQVATSASNKESHAAIDTAYTFILASTTHGAGRIQEILTISDLNRAYTPGSFDLYSGTPFSGSFMESTPVSYLGQSWVASLSPMAVPNGNYYVELTGALDTSKGPVFPVVSITAAGVIPEASTWAMMVAGFAGLGFAGFRTRRSAAAIA